jgi:glycosyltransferase involved in cell wall biosynthesis
VKPIAIVTPWFGEDLKGGAEKQTWQIAHRLCDSGINVEVLTTCCKSFFDDWSTNHRKPGTENQNGITIRRFSVNHRNKSAFNRVNQQMLAVSSVDLRPGVSPVSGDFSAVFARDNINSDTLLVHLAENKEAYHAFLFIPYLYGPILNGLPIVADRAFLQPCLHDEVYAYLKEVEYLFHKAKGILFNSEGEALLAQQLYGPAIIPKGIVVGEGIEAPPDLNSGERGKIGPLDVINSRYVLYLGRRDPTKNVDLLVNAYKRFKKQSYEDNLYLVLAGPGDRSYTGECDGLVDLDFVSETEKSVLLKNCLALFQPSRNESYSRVIMEAWHYHKPIVANKYCLATTTPVQQARGGWLAGSVAEWAAMFHQVSQKSSGELADMGEKGYDYARRHADWDQVIRRYKNIFFSNDHSTVKIQRTGSIRFVHQLLPDVAYGDAITNYALMIKRYLRQNGYHAEIFVERCPDQSLLHEVKFFEKKYLENTAGVIYHHSIGSELTEHAINHSGPKALIYHNITPAEFFESFRPDYSKLLTKGRSELCELAKSFPIAVGDSGYNAEELRANGFPEPDVLPIPVDPQNWNCPPDPDVMNYFLDGWTNLLFVGRIAPNKCQHHLIQAFSSFLELDQCARLILAGYADTKDPYLHYLHRIIKERKLGNHVVVTNRVSHSILHALYRTAHLFWSMSEHEGFCIPLIEAMWFDVPILAFKSSAVPETLGKAGIIFTNKDDFFSLAALAKILVNDEDIKYKVLAAQRQRRKAFTPDVVLIKLLNLVKKMELQFPD